MEAAVLSNLCNRDLQKDHFMYIFSPSCVMPLSASKLCYNCGEFYYQQVINYSCHGVFCFVIYLLFVFLPKPPDVYKDAVEREREREKKD